MTDLVLLYITCANRDEAISLARTLVQEKLVACANVLDGATSLYRWEGKLEEASEAILIAKTQAAKVEEATQCIKSLHSYSVPCIVTLPILSGNADFLQWVTEETK